jgi:hypothetical protein
MMEFGIAIALGLAGSLHCAAMCGPLMLALPVPAGGAARALASRLVYQSGRVFTYCLLGSLAGAAGKTMLAAGAQRWLSIALGVAILLGLAFSKRFLLSAPVIGLVGRLKQAMSAQLRKRSRRSLALLGALNGLLPCGLVYVALAGATAQGTVSGAVLCMALFGLGTLPATLAISLSGKMFPPVLRLKLRPAIPVGLCVVAGLLILRGMALGIPFVSPSLAAGAPGCCLH